MKTYFVDTSYWLALESGDDQNHAAALASLAKFSKNFFRHRYYFVCFRRNDHIFEQPQPSRKSRRSRRKSFAQSDYRTGSHWWKSIFWRLNNVSKISGQKIFADRLPFVCRDETKRVGNCSDLWQTFRSGRIHCRTVIKSFRQTAKGADWWSENLDFYKFFTYVIYAVFEFLWKRRKIIR